MSVLWLVQCVGWAAKVLRVRVTRRGIQVGRSDLLHKKILHNKIVLGPHIAEVRNICNFLTRTADKCSHTMQRR